MSELTPMMQQYEAIKKEAREAVLFFRLGDFYEMFGQDALEASRILDLTLTSRSKGEINPVPMCGVPHHAAENYIARLTKAGKKVAICEQMSDPTLPGIVKRKIVRVITPGTTFSEQVLNQKSNRFVLSIFPQKDYFGLAFADLTTGEFKTVELPGVEEMALELLRLDPAEIVLHRDDYDKPELRALLAAISSAPLSPIDFFEEAYPYLARHFRVTTLDGFGIANLPFAIQASALLLAYLLDTQKDSLAHLDRIAVYHREKTMPLDEATVRNLELFTTLREQENEHTLLSLLDETKTAMGGRLLRRWLTQPLLRRDEIEARHDAVEELVQQNQLRHDVEEGLKPLNDLERLLGRLSSATGNARDLIGLAHSLAYVPLLKSRLATSQALELKNLQKELTPLDELVEKIHGAIVEEPPLRLTEGGLIKPGYHAELDQLHGLMRDAKSALKDIEAREVAATGINSLKVSYNRVFGYYIEVSKTHLAKVPEHYIRKQTLANAERYLTPELKEYEEKVLTAEERAKALEYELFLQVRDTALAHVRVIKQNAALLAELDVLHSFATTALRRRYCRPVLTTDPVLEIVEGRHPVVESITFEQSFVPNSTRFIADHEEIALITGPNMSGKSTYLRQVALIVLMAQIGSFVPATAVRMRVFDRLFTRVGASDNLVRGQSTFMVEMQEAAYILNHATERSLVILDEIGRGTSTYDGLSLAWAIFEHLHDRIRAFTLFATHYHELIQLAGSLSHAKNYSIDVAETARGVLFLHQIKEGGIDKSYGIEVAKLAGLPSPLVDRATHILEALESQHLKAEKTPDNQASLFSQAVRPGGSGTYPSRREPGKLSHPALDKLKTLKLDEMTPLEALNTLNELKGMKS
jgi:DNA mismatch repair protein MutS